MLSESRSYAHRVFHRQGGKLVKGPVDGAGLLEFELAGESFRSAQPFFCDAMTGVARDAVARQGAVLAIGFVRQRENHCMFERLIAVELNLTLAHKDRKSTRLN